MKYFYSVILALFLLLFPEQTFAAFEKFNLGARYIALGGSFSALPGSAFSQFHNPALLSMSGSRNVEFFYSNRYGFSELAQQSFAFSDPVTIQNIGAVGLSFFNYGYELYRDMRFKLSFARMLHPNVYYGAAFNYNTLRIKNYGESACFGLDVGLLVAITPDITAGFSTTNLNQPTIGKTEDKLAHTYQAGLAYFYDTSVCLVFDIETSSRSDLNIRSGLEYTPVQFFSMRAGFSTEPSEFSGGFGLHYSTLDFDYAITSHPDLGLTHALTLGLSIFRSPSPEPSFISSQAQLKETLSEIFKPKQQILNLNTATAKELKSLPGMTKSKLRNILLYRLEYEQFLSVEELLEVKGVSEEWFEKVAPYLTVE